DCIASAGKGNSGPVQNGLYLGVFSGSVDLNNKQGALQVGAGQYAFVALVEKDGVVSGDAPRLLDAPPSIFLSGALATVLGPEFRYDNHREPNPPRVEPPASPSTP
ncbi:MAG TPA: hypothetical protein VFO79_01145, partial [Xanthomonadales bacterium]|nr:hypothetical protein [Xanthomonadales bacterium]